MNRNERRRLAKQNKKNSAAHSRGSQGNVSGPFPDLLEQAIAFQTQGNMGQAEVLYRQVLAQDPANAIANHLLGVVMAKQGDPKKAIELIDKALAVEPRNAEMLSNKGHIEMSVGQFVNAEETFQLVLKYRPGHEGASISLGNIFLSGGRYAEAERSYNDALKANPDNFVVHGNLGIVLHSLERIEEAKASYQKALQLNPNYTGALKNLANALMSEGAIEEGIDVYDRAIALQPDDTGLRVNRSMILPVIPFSVDEIDSYRAKMAENLDHLISGDRVLGEPASEAGVTGFYLAYHARNDVAMVRKITEMYASVCPRLTRSLVQENSSPETRVDRKYRIGFLSHHFHNHTIGKLNRGFIEHFDRDLFEVIVFRTGHTTDALSEAIEHAADRVLHLPETLDIAQQIVADEKLDLLFFPDTGMDAFTYYLAYARLAPVQATSWGHPVTTGITNMDYFVSSTDLETAQGDDHYTETLVRMRNPPTYYYRPEKPATTSSRADFDLPEDANLYLCPQTLFKFHPDFDTVLGRILEADPNGRIVIISGRYANKQRLLTERFARTIPDQVDRILFVPRMPMEHFLQLILISDVIIDPMFFGGGNSSSEAISMGVPIITLAGDYLRDRVTYSFYKAMGFDDLIANDVDDYIEKAVRLANDKSWHQEMSEKLNRHSPRFFENIDTVRELEQFFIAAIEAKRNNQPTIHWGA